jgi:methylmalonyl-CoA mutase N-terminal domain/subunit
MQIEKLKVLKSKRDNEKVSVSLKALNKKAISGENLMPAVLEAVENYCTLGEIADELRKVFGEYK